MRRSPRKRRLPIKTARLPAAGMSCTTAALVQLMYTDPEISLKDRVVKKSEKQGLYNALDIGAIWLERALAGK